MIVFCLFFTAVENVNLLILIIIAASRYLDIGEVVEMDREYWYGQRMDFWDEIIVD